LRTEDRQATDSVAALRELLDALPPDLARNVFTHASWTPKRSDSYERLAFLGDSVLSLAITSHIYPLLEPGRFGAGELTKLRAQTVSGRSCRAVAERLGDNANVVAWDAGNEFARVRPPLRGKVTAGEHASAPAAEFDVAEWSRVIAKALRAGGIAATAGASDGDLIADTNVRLGSLCAPLAFTSLTSTHGTPPFARTRFDPEAVPFLAMLAAAFSFKPVLVSAVGAAPSLDADETAAYAAAVFDRLHADGRLGAYWSSWADLVTADGTLAPVAAALSAFAREARPLRKPNDMPMIAGTYYYRTLPDSTHTLYDAYLGFIEARRIPM